MNGLLLSYQAFIQCTLYEYLNSQRGVDCAWVSLKMNDFFRTAMVINGFRQ
ncbi:MAG: hypothetical protein AB8V34_02625 [Coxiella endosymbiont of Dermacentor nuttalli]